MSVKKDVSEALLLQMVFFLNEKYTKFVRVGLSELNGAILYIVSHGSKGVVEIPMDYEIWNSFIEKNTLEVVETKKKYSEKIENDNDYCIISVVRNVFGKRYLQLRDEIALKNIMLTKNECEKFSGVVAQISSYMEKLYLSGPQIKTFALSFKDDSSMVVDPPAALVYVWTDRLYNELRIKNSTV